MIAWVSCSEALTLMNQRMGYYPFEGRGTVGLSYPSNHIKLNGDKSSVTYVWSVSEGELPPGLFLACSGSMTKYDSSYEHNVGSYGHVPVYQRKRERTTLSCVSLAVMVSLLLISIPLYLMTAVNLTPLMTW